MCPILVLGRKLHERVIVNGGQIVIEVMRLRGDRVRLGFTADPGIRIHREEVQVALDREDRLKAAGTPDGEVSDDPRLRHSFHLGRARPRPAEGEE